MFEPILAKEQVIKGNIEIFKQGVNESTNEITVLPDVTFLIESKTDGSIYRIITNADGKATTETIGGIPYDTYLVSEEKAPDGYLPCEPFEVCINEDGKTLLFVIDNKKCENEEIIVEDTEIIDENPPVNYEEEDEPVRTGDHNPLVKYISLTMITLLIVILCLKKKTTP